jgi:hypothetical protein
VLDGAVYVPSNYNFEWRLTGNLSRKLRKDEYIRHLINKTVVNWHLTVREYRDSKNVFFKNSWWFLNLHFLLWWRHNLTELTVPIGFPFRGRRPRPRRWRPRTDFEGLAFDLRPPLRRTWPRWTDLCLRLSAGVSRGCVKSYIKLYGLYKVKVKGWSNDSHLASLSECCGSIYLSLADRWWMQSLALSEFTPSHHRHHGLLCFRRQGSLRQHREQLRDLADFN